MATLVLLGVSAMTGCGVAGSVRDDVATYSRTGPGGDAALLHGELRDQGGCVVVVDEFGATWVPVFPDDVAWTGDSAEVGGEQLRIGTDVDLGGGEATARDQDWRVPADCPAGVAFWVVSD